MSARRHIVKLPATPLERARDNWISMKQYAPQFHELLGAAFDAGAHWSAGHLAKRYAQQQRRSRS